MMLSSRYQGKILWKKEMTGPFGEAKFNLIYSGFRVKPFGCNRSISAGTLPSSLVGLMCKVPCSFLPSFSQTLKPLATAKVAISGDLDSPPPPPPPRPGNNTNCA